MNRTKRSKIGFVAALLGVLTGCVGYTTYGQLSVSVGVSVGLPSVEIRAESDFYEPLTPYGRWEVVGSYGRCWIPGRVEADWRPYCNGYWQRTEDGGWYWASDEPWAWATYHYGRWDLSPQFGWYWVPQIQWAPSWVSWHSGGGYVGWAPLYPSGVRVISPRAYVFVEERHFMEPVRPSTVVVNNTTIINKTVINQAPATAVIEKASGRKVQAVPVRQLRQKEEAAVVAKQRAPASTSEKNVQTPVPSAPEPAAKRAVAAPVRPVGAQGASVQTGEPAPSTGGASSSKRPQVEKPAAATPESAAPAPRNSKAQSEIRKSVPAAVESKASARPEVTPPAATKAPTGQAVNKQDAKQAKSAQPSKKKAQQMSEQPARERPAASENNRSNPADKNRDNKGKE